MRETTKSHIRKQSSTIDGMVGTLQVLSETTLIGRESIQKRLIHLAAALNTVSDTLIEIQANEAGVDA